MSIIDCIFAIACCIVLAIVVTVSVLFVVEHVNATSTDKPQAEVTQSEFPCKIEQTKRVGLVGTMIVFGCASGLVRNQVNVYCQSESGCVRLD